MYDVAVIGAGTAGMATTARLQARGLSTVLFEAHGQPGGCAGFFRRRGFAFDVGATTLVDFEPGVSAVPAALTARLGPPEVGRALAPYVQRDAAAQGGAVLVFLGVPEAEAAGQPFTHHQLLQDYGRPLGNGNNMFMSVTQRLPAKWELPSCVFCSSTRRT